MCKRNKNITQTKFHAVIQEYVHNLYSPGSGYIALQRGLACISKASAKENAISVFASNNYQANFPL